MSWPNRAIRALDDLERVALALVARLGPWAAPVAPAYFVARAAERHLEAWRPVAIAMAVAVEAVGIAAAHATLRAWTWNRERPAGAPSGPAWLGLALVGVYLVVGVLLAVLVELAPWLIPLAPAAFFLLAGVAYAVLAMMADQARREAQAGQAAELAKAERSASRAFWAAARERGMSRAEARSALARQGGDHLGALESLPAGPGPVGPGSGVGLERAGGLEAMLAAVGQRSQGRSFSPADVQRWAGLGRTRAYELLGDAQRRGLVRRLARGRYVLDGVTSSDEVQLQPERRAQ